MKELTLIKEKIALLYDFRIIETEDPDSFEAKHLTEFFTGYGERQLEHIVHDVVHGSKTIAEMLAEKDMDTEWRNFEVALRKLNNLKIRYETGKRYYSAKQISCMGIGALDLFLKYGLFTQKANGYAIRINHDEEDDEIE